jgi:Xaa-Pro aminopeptidase
LIERLGGRWTCPTCGRVYHETYNPPKTRVCDVDGTQLIQREDDKAETVERRIRVYMEQTSPLIEYYRQKGLLVEVDGTQSIEEVRKKSWRRSERRKRVSMAWDRQITIKTPQELAIMRAAGKINAEALAAARAAIRPGATTADLNAAAEEVLRKYGVISPFKNYPGAYPYPASTTISVNEELVHGIPGEAQAERRRYRLGRLRRGV